MTLNLNTQLAGHFTLKVTNIHTGKERTLADFPNLILNAGLERMGTDSYLDVCRVGTGNSTPIVSQTQLDNKIASTSTTSSNTSGAQATAPYFGWRRTTFRFAAGLVGNLSEVGVGWGNTTTDNFLFSRALILDINGDPTTINVLADEVLDVIYELRLYPPSADIIITGLNLGLTTHTVTVRPGRITDGNYWGSGIGDPFRFSLSGYSGRVYAYNGAIGAITSAPSGDSSGSDVDLLNYSPNSYERRGVLTYSLSQANLAGGILAVEIPTTLGTYQFGFSPAVAKTSDKIFKLDLKVSWGRYVP